MHTTMAAQQGNRSGGISRHLVVLGLFAILSVILTYPLVRYLDSRILGMPGDNFAYLHKIRWFKQALFDRHVSPFFDPFVFHPFGYNVALTEMTLSNIIPALPLVLLFGEVIAYNLWMLGSFALSGLAMYLLVLRLSGSRSAGLLSGLVFAFCPYRMVHLGTGHLPLMATQWLPLLFLYLDRMIVRHRSGDALMAALFYALGALSAWYYAYMFALAGLAYVLLRGRPWRQYLWQRQCARCVLVFVFVCLVLVGPSILLAMQAQRETSGVWSLRYMDRFSASPLDFISPNVLHPVWGEWLMGKYTQGIPEHVLYLGLTPIVLTIIGLWHGSSRVQRAFALVSLIFAVMAMGTTLHWGNSRLYVSVPGWLERVFTVGMGFLTKRLALYPISSYSLRVEGAIYLPMPALLLYLYVPFFNAVRVCARFGLITAFGVSVLAGYGLQRLCRERGRQETGARSRLRGLAVTIALSCFVIFEFAACPFALGTCSVQARPVDEWLAAQSGDFAVIEYPLIKAINGRSLYTIRTHGKRLSYGLSTFHPGGFAEKRPVLERFPSDETVALLKEWGVRYVLVGARSYGTAWPQLEDELSAASDLRHVLTLEELPIYEGDRILHLLPTAERAFIVDLIYVYEVL